MAQTGFQIQCWGRKSASANEPIQTSQVGSIVSGVQRFYSYYSPVDTQATCAASGYFNTVAFDLTTGDYIEIYSASEGTLLNYFVTSNESIDPSTTLTPTITLSLIGAGFVRSATTLTAAQIISGYTTPNLLLAAPGANRMYTDVSAQLVFTYGSAQFTTGGTLAVQYGNTTHGGGVLATSSLTNTQVNGIAANDVAALISATVVPTAWANVINNGLYLSNDTAAFAVGTGTTLFIVTNARVVPTA